jgi:hypothetical protein
MFQALLAQLEEALHDQQLVFCVRVTSVATNRHNMHAEKAVVHAAPPENEQVVLETRKGC